MKFHLKWEGLNQHVLFVLKPAINPKHIAVNSKMATIFIFALCLYFLNGAHSNLPGPRITVKQGTLTGLIVNTEKGREVFAFRGIPYAKPPVNELRFKLPVPAEPWEGVLQADTNQTISCPQMGSNKEYVGTENCLLLNVYIPSKTVNKKAKLPIMVYIHGGGQNRDSGMNPNYYPTKLLEKDIILVTISFRLAILGCLCSGDEVIPGNLGMFDQVLALKWIQENIDSFGGDPGKVTLFGQSAGASAITLHLISPHSKNLFRGAIVQSGSYMGLQSISPHPRKWAKRLAMKLKCPSVTMQQLLDCLKTKSAKELALAPDYFYAINQLPKIYGTVAEKTPNGFIPFDPEQDLHKIKIDVPVMIGTVSEEGYILYDAFSKFFSQDNQAFLDYDLKTIFQFLHDYGGNVDNYCNAIVQHFFKNISTTNKEEFKNALMKLYSGLYNDEGIQRFSDLVAAQNIPQYSYRFSYRGNVCLAVYNCTNPGNRGPTHGEDMPFLFPIQKLTEADSKFSETVVDLWTNFATYQNPTPNEYSSFKWLPTHKEYPQYLDINLQPKMVAGHLTENVDIWMKARETMNNCY